MLQMFNVGPDHSGEFPQEENGIPLLMISIM